MKSSTGSKSVTKAFKLPRELEPPLSKLLQKRPRNQQGSLDLAGWIISQIKREAGVKSPVSVEADEVQGIYEKLDALESKIDFIYQMLEQLLEGQIVVATPAKPKRGSKSAKKQPSINNDAFANLLGDF